ncbi:hypothetical protein D050_0764A, partial [Vibrio parahaemolyticus VPCR-2009]
MFQTRFKALNLYINRCIYLV